MTENCAHNKSVFPKKKKYNGIYEVDRITKFKACQKSNIYIKNLSGIDNI